MIKELCLKKSKFNSYRVFKCNDKLFESIYLFLCDGLGSESYINFLKDKERNSFGGNVSYLEKKNGNVIISLDESVFDDIDPISVNAEDLLSVLQDWRKYTLEGMDTIVFTFDMQNRLSIQGS